MTSAPLPREPYRRRPVPPDEALELAQRELRLASERRSIREFSSEPVPRALIDTALRIACTAPSGANRQPWRFVAVSDPALKRRIREAAEEEEREFYAQRAPPEWLEALAPLGTDPSKPFLEVAPWLVVVFQIPWEPVAGRRVKNYYAQESVGIATGLLIQALHRLGLATLTHTPAPMGFVQRLLGRPRNEKPFVILPVGHPADGCTVPRLPRKPLDQMIEWR